MGTMIRGTLLIALALASMAHDSSAQTHVQSQQLAAAAAKWAGFGAIHYKLVDQGWGFEITDFEVLK